MNRKRNLMVMLIVAAVILFGYEAFCLARGLLATNDDATLSNPVIPTFVATEKPKIIPTIINTATTVSVQPTIEPTMEPVLTYEIGKIDLASHNPIAMLITSPEKNSEGELKMIAGSWAEATADGDKDAENYIKFFYHPGDGTTLATIGDEVLLQVHSGQAGYQWNLFASQLDLYVRKADGKYLTLEESQKKLDGLMNGVVYLCQSETEKTLRTTPASCEGMIVERFQLTASAIVLQEDVDRYEDAIIHKNLRSWMASKYKRGFENLDPGNSIMVLTCLQQLRLQPDVKGVLVEEFNRLVLGLTKIQ